MNNPKALQALSAVQIEALLFPDLLSMVAKPTVRKAPPPGIMSNKDGGPYR